MRTPRPSPFRSLAFALVVGLAVTLLLTPEAIADDSDVMRSLAGSQNQATGAFDGTYAYLMGGCTSTRIARYSPAADTWTQMSQSLPQPRAYATSVYTANSKVYVFGGRVHATDACGSGVRTNSVLRYTIGTGVTTLSATMPRALDLMASAYDGSRYVYLFGGAASSTDVRKEILRFDTQTETFTSYTVQLPFPYYYGSAVWLSGSAYIFGAHNFNEPHVVKFTPAAGTATDVGDLPCPGCDVGEHGMATAVLNGAIYVLGGTQDDRVFRVTPSGSSITSTEMPEQLVGNYVGHQTGFSHGGFAYYHGSAGTTSSPSAAYVQYDPSFPIPGTASITTSPAYGAVGTPLSFTASATNAYEYGWDWDGDHVVDSNDGSQATWRTSGSVTHAFPADGSYTIHAIARNFNGDAGAWSEARIVNIDGTPPHVPTITSTTHADPSAWYDHNDPAFSWTQSDPTPGSGIKGSRWASDAAVSGPYVWRTNDSAADIADGVHTLNVEVSDNASNVRSATFTLRVDTQDPTSAAVVAPPPNGANGWHTSNVALSIASADALTAAPCEHHSTSPTGPWDTSTCDTADTWIEADEGNRTWYGYARDLAGNARAGDDALLVKLDKTPPSITDNQPDTAWVRTSPALDVDFGDATSGLASIEYTIWSGPGKTGVERKAWTSIFSSTNEGNTSFLQPWQVDSTALVAGDNYVSVRATDQAGLASAANDVVKIQWDITAPTKATPIVTSGTANGVWYRTDVGLAIDSADGTSGVATEWHSPTSAAGPWSGGGEQDAWTDATEGTQLWYGRAIDAAGNVFVSTGLEVRIDKTAPQTSLVPSGTAGNAGWYVSNAQATLNGQDATSQIAHMRYRIASGAWEQVAASSTTFPITGDGQHVVSYYGVDHAGNADGSDAAPRTTTISIDTSPPASAAAVTSGTPGLAGWYLGTVGVTINATDATSGVQRIWYSWDGDVWRSTNGASTVTTIATAGEHTLSYYAEDVAGNADGSPQVPRTLALRLDLAPPASNASLQGTPGDAGWFVTPVTVTVAATDDASGAASIAYGIDDDDTPLAYGGGFVLGQEGTRTIFSAARDVAGRLESPPASRVVKIDLAAPTYSQWARSPANIHAGSAGAISVSVSIDDGASGAAEATLRWSYDSGSTWSAWTALTPIGGTTWAGSIPEPSPGWWSVKSKTLMYEVRARDAAGHASTSAPLSDLVERVAPTVVITSPAPFDDLGAGLREVQFTSRDLDHDTVTYRVLISRNNGATWETTPLCDMGSFAESGAPTERSCTFSTNAWPDGATYAFRVVADDAIFVADSVVLDVTIDRTRPTVEIVSPEPYSVCTLATCAPVDLGYTIVAGVVTIRAEALDPGSAPSGVERVEFFIDDELLATVDEPAASGYYQASWNTGAAVGDHTIRVVAYDAAGNVSLADELAVSVLAPGA